MTTNPIADDDRPQVRGGVERLTLGPIPTQPVECIPPSVCVINSGWQGQVR